MKIKLLLFFTLIACTLNLSRAGSPAPTSTTQEEAHVVIPEKKKSRWVPTRKAKYFAVSVIALLGAERVWMMMAGH